MKLSVKNLGPISEGLIDLGKSLTILTGPNNTGKSYLTYLIHGISQYEALIGIHEGVAGLSSIFNNTNNFSKRVNEGDILNLDSMLISESQNIANFITESVKNNYSKIFASSSIKPEIHLDLSTLVNYANRSYYKDVHTVEGNLRGIPWGRESEEIPLREVSSPRFPSVDSRIAYLLSISTAVCLDYQLGARSRFFPAERTAINLFAKHITSTKAEIKDEIDAEIIAGMTDNEIGRMLRTQIASAPKYPYALRDYINFVNDFDKPEEEGKLAYIAASMEAALINGKVALDEFNQLIFTPTASQIPLELHLSSSLVKSLSYLILYLRYTAKESDQVIIDEPELNLHPDLQISLAKVIAQMVNAGLKVIISTHSDYLVKELNNIILLGELNKEDKHKSFIAQKGFVEDELLTREQVEAYFLHNNPEGGTIIEPINLEEDGLVVPTINDAIRRVDGLAEEIFMEMEG